MESAVVSLFIPSRVAIGAKEAQSAAGSYSLEGFSVGAEREVELM